MAYPTLPDIKARLGVTSNDSDAFLTASLAAARGAVEKFTGYRWEYPDSETRTFEIYDTVRRLRAAAVFDVHDPGLLSYTSVRAWLRWEEPRVIPDRSIVVRRTSPRGKGPYSKMLIAGAYDFAEITGVFGRGLVAPAEVAEAVMLVAMTIFSQGSGLGLAATEDVDMSLFQDDLLRFLLRGHMSYR